MIHIVLFFKDAYDGDCVFSILVKLFKDEDYEFSYDLISNQIFFRNAFEDDYRKELQIDVRFGDICKLGGLRPDFYYSDTKDGENFLEQGAAKVDGIRLVTWLDALKLVELFRR